jgi:hypothetical protein
MADPEDDQRIFALCWEVAHALNDANYWKIREAHQIVECAAILAVTALEAWKQEPLSVEEVHNEARQSARGACNAIMYIGWDAVAEFRKRIMVANG